MKAFSLLVVFMLFSVLAGAQSDAVTKAFADKYPAVKSVKWQSKDGDFLATFKQGANKTVALFSAKGEWKQTTMTIDEDDLPAEVKKSIGIQYARFEIDIVEQLLRPGKEMAYQTYLDTDDLTIRAVFDAKGKLLESEKMTED